MLLKSFEVITVLYKEVLIDSLLLKSKFMRKRVTVVGVLLPLVLISAGNCSEFYV